MTAGSAGNHAQAVAFAARYFGVPCDIFVPAGAPITKIEACQAYGATVVEGGDSLDEAIAAARAARRAQRARRSAIPFDDPAVVAGQGTLGLELLDDLDDLGCVVVPLGGGGLASGVAIAVKSLPPDVRVVGVQAAACSPYAGGASPPGPVPTLADGIAVKRPGAVTGPLVERWIDEIVTVDEDAIADAMVMLMDRAKLYVEGAGAVGVAALQSGAVDPAPDGHDVRRAVGRQRRPRRGARADPPPRERRPGGGSSSSPASTTGRAGWCGSSPRSPPPAPTWSRSSTSARASTSASARPASTPRSRSAAPSHARAVVAAARAAGYRRARVEHL